MKPFIKIYNELQFYSAFTPNPSNEHEAIKSINCFFSELQLHDEDLEQDERTSFLVMSYRHTARQWALDWKTESRSFKRLLRETYESLYKTECYITTKEIQ